MKKTIALLLAVCMLLSVTACGGTQEAVSSAPESVAAPETFGVEVPSPEVVEEAPSVVEESIIEESVVEEAPVEELMEEDVGFFNPLTGEATEVDISMNRPYVAMLNTIEQALPQSSNSKADMLIEATEEGGITRVMGVYQDLTDVGTIGTIRSTREYFVALCMGLDALMIHAGCSKTATAMLEEYDYGTLDYMSLGSLYWRDSWRMENIASEHSLYTSSENILGYMEKGNVRAEHEDGFVSPYVFTEDGTPADGQNGTDISVTFSSYKTTRFVYDEESKTYKVFAYGEEYVDEAADNLQVAVTNVIVIPTEQTDIGFDGLQRFDLSEGTGYFACGGKAVEIKWEKGDDDAPLYFYNQDGTPLELGVGKSYICILGDTQPITIE